MISQANSPLNRVARISAWLLLATIVVMIVSGWGITRTEIIYNTFFGLIDRGLADSIHRTIQIPMAAIFLTHVLVSSRVYFFKAVRPMLANALLIAIGIIVFGIFIYVEQA